MKWFLKCFRQYADFKGRARRSEYWWFTVYCTIIYLIPIIGFLLQAILVSGDDDVNMFILQSPFLWILIAFGIALLIPTLAVTVRRLHDIGRSGWWILLSIGADVIATIADGIEDEILYIIFGILSFAADILFLVWMFTNSQSGDNEWGPNPKKTQEEITDNQQETCNV